MRYHRPRDVADALSSLTGAGGDGRILVGGTDLIVGMRHHTVEPDVLIDLKSASDVPAPIEVDDPWVRIGPTATMADLSGDARIRHWYPGLVDAVVVVGSVAIRNRASLIGNICNASPAADTVPALLVHGAQVIIAARDGLRTVPLSTFFLGPGRTLCGPDELVLRLDLPIPADGFTSAFARLTRRRGVDLATVSVAAAISPDDQVTLGLGAVGPTPLLSDRSTPADLGDERSVIAAVDPLVQMATPISDVRGSQEYRSAMVRVLAKRAVMTALQRRTSGHHPPLGRTS